MIFPPLVHFLLQQPSLIEAIDDRLYHRKIPASTSETPNQLPLMTYHLVNEPLRPTHDKKFSHKAQVLLSTWAGTTKSAYRTSEILFKVLEGYQGNMGPASESIEVGRSHRTNIRDNTDAENVELFCVEQIFEIQYGIIPHA